MVPVAKRSGRAEESPMRVKDDRPIGAVGAA
ncbi:MAG: hypothetical protein HW375_1552, partial [Anaerolineales bacterium]|nr:hypothetical protein [Anaerolineales bacterium]